MADLGSERSSEQKVAGGQAGVKLEASQEMACEELRVWIGVQEMGKAWGLSRDVTQRVKLVDETMIASDQLQVGCTGEGMIAPPRGWYRWIMSNNE